MNLFILFFSFRLLLFTLHWSGRPKCDRKLSRFLVCTHVSVCEFDRTSSLSRSLILSISCLTKLQKIMHFNLKHSKAHSRCWLPCHNYVGAWASEQLCVCAYMALSIYEIQRFWNFNNSSFWTFRTQHSRHKIRLACLCVCCCSWCSFSSSRIFCLLQRVCRVFGFSSSFIFISSVFWLRIIFISRLFLTDASIRSLRKGFIYLTKR